MHKKKVTATVYSRYSAGTMARVLSSAATYWADKLSWFICSESAMKRFCPRRDAPCCRGKCKKFTVTVEEVDGKD